LKRARQTLLPVADAEGLSQEEAAHRARLDYKHWQLIETGKTNTTVASLVGIARALRVKLASLFEGV